jgi:hypothetical protein
VSFALCGSFCWIFLGCRISSAFTSALCPCLEGPRLSKSVCGRLSLKQGINQAIFDRADYYLHVFRSPALAQPALAWLVRLPLSLCARRGSQQGGGSPGLVVGCIRPASQTQLPDAPPAQKAARGEHQAAQIKDDNHSPIIEGQHTKLSSGAPSCLVALCPLRGKAVSSSIEVCERQGWPLQPKKAPVRGGGAGPWGCWAPLWSQRRGSASCWWAPKYRL